jgi:hypothetical protein
MTGKKYLGEGAHVIPAAEYHLDPCKAPSLSRGIIKDLVGKSPAHAWVNSPRLNPNYEARTSTKFDIGHAFESMFIRDGADLAIVEADDWRTKAAKEARERAYASNTTPILQADAERVMKMVRSVRHQLEFHDADIRDAFDEGIPSQTLIWKEKATWCRVLLDWAPGAGDIFFDVKTTATLARADKWGQTVFWDTGCDVQAAWYTRGIRKTLGIKNPQLFFLVVEVDPPYAMSVMCPDQATLHIGEGKVERGLELWNWCLKHGKWPSYPRQTQLIMPPPWQLARYEEARLAEVGDRNRFGDDLLQTLVDWQAP